MSKERAVFKDHYLSTGGYKSGANVPYWNTCVMNPKIYYKFAALTVVMLLIELVSSENKAAGKYLFGELMKASN